MSNAETVERLRRAWLRALDAKLPPDAWEREERAAWIAYRAAADPGRARAG